MSLLLFKAKKIKSIIYLKTQSNGLFTAKLLEVARLLTLHLKHSK